MRFAKGDARTQEEFRRAPTLQRPDSADLFRHDPLGRRLGNSTAQERRIGSKPGTQGVGFAIGGDPRPQNVYSRVQTRDPKGRSEIPFSGGTVRASARMPAIRTATGNNSSPNQNQFSTATRVQCQPLDCPTTGFSWTMTGAGKIRSISAHRSCN